MLAAIIPNQAGLTQALDDFSVSVDEVEARTGLDFFSALEDTEEAALESLRRTWR
jgi:endonuclease G, mitochondrial